MEQSASTTRILDYVVDILRAAGRPMSAKEIRGELQRKGMALERTELTQILWKENDRSELVVDRRNFKWRYDSNAATQSQKAEARKEEYRRELAKQAGILEIWENLGFEFLGVWRKGTEKPLFFLRQEGREYLVVGPTGRLFREDSTKFSTPDSVPPSEFSAEQIKKAAHETLAARRRQIIEDSREIIRRLRETEVHADEVYLGPAMVRIEDVIPASGVILVGNVSALEPCILSIGWGVVLEPLYLVINILGLGILSDTRYGVFKVCVYELLKRDLMAEAGGYLNFRLSLVENRVHIGGGKNILSLF